MMEVMVEQGKLAAQGQVVAQGPQQLNQPHNPEPQGLPGLREQRLYLDRLYGPCRAGPVVLEGLLVNRGN